MKKPKLRTIAYYLLPLLLFLFQCNGTNDNFTGVIHSGTTKNKAGSSLNGTYKVKTICNSEIPSQIREKIYSNHLWFMAALQTKKKRILKNLLCKKFKDNDIDNIFKVIENHDPFEDLILLNEYYSIVESNGDVSYSIIPDRKSLFIINSVNFKNKEIYNVFQVSPGPIYQQLYHTMYVLEDDSWKVANFYTGLYAIANKNANEWHKIAKDTFLNADPFVSYFSSLISKKLQRTIPYLQLREEGEIVKNNHEIQKASYSIINNPEFFKLSETDKIIGFNFEITGYGCCPIINYAITKKVDDWEKYSRYLSSELNRSYPEIKKFFKIICFQAFDRKLSDENNNKFLNSTVVEIESNKIIKH